MTKEGDDELERVERAGKGEWELGERAAKANETK
jgi:hypothetical protein